MTNLFKSELLSDVNSSASIIKSSSAKQEVIVPADAGKAAGLKRPNLLMGK
jgi:hypothetical protein